MDYTITANGNSKIGTVLYLNMEWSVACIKLITIVIDAASVMLQIVASLTIVIDDAS